MNWHLLPTHVRITVHLHSLCFSKLQMCTIRFQDYRTMLINR